MWMPFLFYLHMITNLPIESIRHKLLESLHACKRFVLSAPTGSGKSTQVPQMLLDGHPELKGAIFGSATTSIGCQNVG